MDFASFKGQHPPAGIVERQTDFDVTIGQFAVSDRILRVGYIPFRHETLSDGDVKVCLFPWQMIGIAGTTDRL